MLHLTSCVSDFPATPSEARELARRPARGLPDDDQDHRGYWWMSPRWHLTQREAMICAAALRRAAGECGG